MKQGGIHAAGNNVKKGGTCHFVTKSLRSTCRQNKYQNKFFQEKIFVISVINSSYGNTFPHSFQF